MLQQLSSENMTKGARDDHQLKWGRYNDFPPGFKEITAEEFAQSGFFTWCKTGMEFRQPMGWDKLPSGILLKPFGNGDPAIIMFFMNHDCHFAMAHDYWAKEVRYFTFADCYHDWVEISAEEAGKTAWPCYHYYKCSKCGAQHEQDSSG